MSLLLTPFGTAARKLRLDIGARIIDMAEWLGKPPAYVSAMETGKKNLTSAYLESVIEYFKFHNIDTTGLRDTLEKSRKEYRINMEGQSNDSRELVATFARRFPTMDENEKKDLFNFLSK